MIHDAENLLENPVMNAQVKNKMGWVSLLDFIFIKNNKSCLGYM